MSLERNRRVRTLKARAEHLERRLEERGDVPAASYDRAELSALKWAMPILEGHVQANDVLRAQLRENDNDGP